MQLTEPFDAAVVVAAQIADCAIPKRTSLPSMFPPAEPGVAARLAPASASAGVPPCSSRYTPATQGTSTTSIARSNATPWRRSRTMAPNVKHSAAGISRIDSDCSRLLSASGFSSGWAELALKKPPPFVPSCMIAICDAAGPSAIVCWVRSAPSAPGVASSSSTVAEASKVCTTPRETSTSASRQESGIKTCTVERTRSTQKEPTVVLARRAKPRMSATSTAMPVAAETKFWTVSPSIWTR